MRLPSTGHARRSTTAGSGGRARACGAGHSLSWQRPAVLRPSSCSTAPTPRRTAVPLVAKGADAQSIGRSHGGRTTKLHALVDGKGSTHASIGGVRHHARPARRRARGHRTSEPGTAMARPRSRHSLRQRCPAALPGRARHDAGHSQQPDPQAPPPVRPPSLQAAQRHRTHVLPPEGLPTRRHSAHDRLACTYDAAVCLAATIIWWL